jgi:uncharacterized protein YbbK (DUF523 family)
MTTAADPPLPQPAVRLGVSECLLGRQVRFNGGHERDLFLLGTLGPRVQWTPVCPEVAIGLGIPRESVRLVQTKDGLRMVAPARRDADVARARRVSRRPRDDAARAQPEALRAARTLR